MISRLRRETRYILFARVRRHHHRDLVPRQRRISRAEQPREIFFLLRSIDLLRSLGDGTRVLTRQRITYAHLRDIRGTQSRSFPFAPFACVVETKVIMRKGSISVEGFSTRVRNLAIRFCAMSGNREMGRIIASSSSRTRRKAFVLSSEADPLACSLGLR